MNNSVPQQLMLFSVAALHSYFGDGSLVSQEPPINY